MICTKTARAGFIGNGFLRFVQVGAGGKERSVLYGHITSSVSRETAFVLCHLHMVEPLLNHLLTPIHSVLAVVLLCVFLLHACKRHQLVLRESLLKYMGREYIGIYLCA